MVVKGAVMREIIFRFFLVGGVIAAGAVGIELVTLGLDPRASTAIGALVGFLIVVSSALLPPSGGSK